MENRYVIQLEDKTMVALAGFPYGNKLFEKQVGKENKLTGKTTIVFPPELKMVATSFVQGFFDVWLNRYGLGYVLDHIEIEATEKIKSQVEAALCRR